MFVARSGRTHRGRSDLRAKRFDTNSRRCVRPERVGHFGLRAHVDHTEVRSFGRLDRRAGVPFGSAAVPSTSATLTVSTTSRPSLRHYVRAAELKAAGQDWTEVLAVEPDNPPARLAAELLASALHSGTNARARAFVAQGGGCRATFFNYRRRLTGGSATNRR
jgi:hypothetical protein